MKFADKRQTKLPDAGGVSPAIPLQRKKIIPIKGENTEELFSVLHDSNIRLTRTNP